MNFITFMCIVNILLVYKSYAFSVTNQLLSTISGHNNLYQSIVFLNNDLRVNITFLNQIFRTLSQEIPVIIVDLSKEIDSTELVQYSKFTTLHIIIDSDDSDGAFTNRTYNTMSLIAEMTPILTRPKCLLLLLSKNISFNYTLKTILLEAWSLKFLNFSIIKFVNESRSVVVNYNPFTKSFCVNNLQSTISVFPDKLKYMNKHPFRLAIFNESIILNMKTDSQNTLKVNGLHYPFFEIFAEKLNFVLDYKIYDSSNYSEMLERLYKELESGDINAVPIVMISAMVYGNKHTIGKAITDSKLVIIVPVLPTSKLSADLNVFYLFFVFPAIVLLLYITKLCLKLTEMHWQSMNIVAILLGMTLKNQPRRIAERIIFMSVVIASINCSSDLLAKLTNIKLVNEEELFNSVQSIVDSGLPIYGMKRLIGSNESTLDHEIKSRARLIASASDCVQILLANSSAICITAYINSRLLIGQHVSGGRRMKLAGPTFQYDFVAFPFERNSPFLERFDDITQRIIEAGVHQAWEYARCAYASYSRSKQQMEEDKEIHMFELGVFLASAYLLAAITFIGELLQYNYLNRKTKKR